MKKRQGSLGGIDCDQWGKSFFAGLIREFRRRGYTDEMIKDVVAERSEVLTNLADWCASYVHVFPFITGAYTTEEIIEAGKYDKVCDSIKSLNLPMCLSGGEKRVLELLDFNTRDYDTRYMIRKAKKLGLKEPTWADALYFGINFPEEQRKRVIVFPHKPWIDWQGRNLVTVLFGDCSKRILGSGYFNQPGIGDNVVCAFIQ